MIAKIVVLCLCLATAWARADVSEARTANMTLKTTRSSYYCEWRYWKNYYWTSLTEVDWTRRVRSFKSCAMRCCRNPYCATFDWNKKRRQCYEYNENINDLYSSNFVRYKRWYAGSLTYKNGYSY